MDATMVVERLPRHQLVLDDLGGVGAVAGQVRGVQRRQASEAVVGDLGHAAVGVGGLEQGAEAPVPLVHRRDHAGSAAPGRRRVADSRWEPRVERRRLADGQMRVVGVVLDRGEAAAVALGGGAEIGSARFTRPYPGAIFSFEADFGRRLRCQRGR